jgi:tRNA (cmo5U34)-methyltransferase
MTANAAISEPSPSPAEQSRDLGLAPARWTFNAEVTAAFDDMLARSIPQYAVMRQACFDLGCRLVKPATTIVDLGCARGEALAPFVERFGAYNRYVGVDVSGPMLQAARERFAGWSGCGLVEIRELDLRHGYPPVAASLTLAVLTLQFVPIEHRQRLVRNIYRHTVSSGGLLLVEKILGETAELDQLMKELHWAMKERNGYSREAIDRKRLALEGVLVPVTARWNEELLRSAGFAQVDCFWRWMNFAGWLAVKE